MRKCVQSIRHLHLSAAVQSAHPPAPGPKLLPTFLLPSAERSWKKAQARLSGKEKSRTSNSPTTTAGGDAGGTVSSKQQSGRVPRAPAEQGKASMRLQRQHMDMDGGGDAPLADSSLATGNSSALGPGESAGDAADQGALQESEDYGGDDELYLVNRIAEGSYRVALSQVPRALSDNLVRIAKEYPRKLIREDVDTVADYFILRNRLRNSAKEVKEEKTTVVRLSKKLELKKRYASLVPPSELESWEIVDENGQPIDVSADDSAVSEAVDAVADAGAEEDSSAEPLDVSQKFRFLFSDAIRQKVRAEEIQLKASPSPFRFDPRVTLAHALFQVPFDYGPVDRIMNELKNRIDYNFSPRTVLDHGSAVGVASWVMKEHFPAISECYYVHHSQAAVDLADNLALDENRKRIFPELRIRRFIPSASSTLYDFVVSVNSFAELEPKQKLQLVEQLWERTSENGCLILVEHGDRLGFRDIMAAREKIFEIERREARRNEGPVQAHVVAPCQHDKLCPLISAMSLDVCNFTQKISLPEFRQFSSSLRKGSYVHSKYSYVVMMKSARPAAEKKSLLSDWGRVVLGAPKHLRQHVLTNVCTHEGEILYSANITQTIGKELFRDMKLRDEGDLIPVFQYTQALEDAKQKRRDRKRDMKEAASLVRDSVAGKEDA